MELALLWGSTALVVFALGAVARHDWLRLTRPSIGVKAKVIGHRSNWDDGQRVFAARFAFDVAGRRIEVVDQQLGPRRSPAVDTEVLLYYPQGRPDLARIRRPVTWLIVYVVLLATFAMLVIALRAHLQ